MFCPECGKKIGEQAGFCPECGEKTSKSQEKASKAPETATSKTEATSKISPNLIYFLVGGLVLAGLGIGGFYYWQNKSESGYGGYSKTDSVEEKGVGQKTKIAADKLITKPAYQLVLTKEDGVAGLEFTARQDMTSLIKEEKSGLYRITDGMEEAAVAAFDDLDENSILINLAIRYSSVDAAKKAYKLLQQNWLEIIFESEEDEGVPITLTAQSFGDESDVMKFTLPNEEESMITCFFRRGNIIEILAPADKVLVENDVYKIAKILEEKIRRPASSEDPTEPTEYSAKKQNKAMDARVKMDVNALRNAAIQYAVDNNGFLPETMEELVDDYLTKVPTNPITGESYQFQTKEGSLTVSGSLSDGTDYTLTDDSQ